MAPLPANELSRSREEVAVVPHEIVRHYHRVHVVARNLPARTEGRIIGVGGVAHVRKKKKKNRAARWLDFMVRKLLSCVAKDNQPSDW